MGALAPDVGIVVLTSALAPPNVPSIEHPDPSAPTASTKYSAALGGGGPPM